MPTGMQDRARLLDRAQNAKRESKYVEFKGEFDVRSHGAWCELGREPVNTPDGVRFNGP
jgi:hypothetical protein